MKRFMVYRKQVGQTRLLTGPILGYAEGKNEDAARKRFKKVHKRRDKDMVQYDFVEAN